MSVIFGIKALFESRRVLSRLNREQPSAYADRLIRQSRDALTEAYGAIARANRLLAKGLTETVAPNGDMVQDGRFIRVGKYPGDVCSISYIVAIADPEQAIDLIRANASVPGDDIEDLGRLGSGLLMALRLGSGQYVRAWSVAGAVI